MEANKSTIHDVVEKVRSWIPRGSLSQAISRDYWMPDSSCSVCYECDSHFSLFNRRHHCRICGRIFCGKCTQDTIPTTDYHTSVQGEGERIRVCKFCFNTREQNLACPNGEQSATPTLTPSSSCRSLASNSTSGGSSTASSIYPGTGLMGSSFRANLGEIMGADKRPFRMTGLDGTSHRSMSPRVREGSPSPYDFCSKSRSEDDDDESQRETAYNDLRLQQMQKYSKQDEEVGSGCVDMDNPGYTSSHILPSEISSYCRESIMKAGADCHNRGKENKYVKNLTNESASNRSGTSLEYYEGAEEIADDNSFYAALCKEPSSIHEAEAPLDVENNPSIWAAPPPEDGEDELANNTGDDEDDDMEGVWTFSRSFGNLSCNEYRKRQKAPLEDQRKAMRQVVDGHFRVLVAQLLSGEGIQAEDSGQESWLEIVTALSLLAASYVKPDTSGGGGMDPGGYVKVKCVATGLPSESRVLKGIVCKKNVAHRRMTSRYENPRLLLLGCAMEYERVSNHFSSLETLLQQEKDYLSMAVARIEAHRPNVLLVEKTVSRQAQEHLLAREISFVLNIKRDLLERIAKFTGASIVSNLDHLPSVKATKVGRCELFHVEKYVEEHGSAGQSGKKLQKTLMFFEGCPKPWGCTILLKGSNGDELKKVKQAVQFAVFAAHHLALETSFLADEGATLPELFLKSPLSVTLPDKQSKSDRSISAVSGILAASQSQAGNRAQDCPFSLVNAAVSPHSNSMSILDRSGFKGSSQVSSMARFANSSPLKMQEDRFTDANIKTSTSGASFKLHEVIGTGIGKLSPDMSLEDFQRGISGLSASLRKGYLGTSSTPSTKFSAPENPVSTQENNSICPSESCSKNTLHGFCDSSSLIEDHIVDRQLERMDSNGISPELHHDLQTSYQEGEYQGFIHEEFPPSTSDHQSILVSFSSSCLKKRSICERGHLYRIKYYGPSDKPLGRFLRNTVFDSSYKCPSCGEPKCAHFDCYTHQQGRLTISVHRESQLQTFSGEKEGKIWMWHRCLKCPRIDGVPRATHRVVMSDAAWGLSFGKFLELSFSNHAAASRPASCGHSLHRDCLRFYGFGEMVACFRYSPVNVYSVHLPPSKLEFLYFKQQDWLQQEVYEVAEKGEHFFKKLTNNLHQIEERIASDNSGRVPEVKRRISDMHDLLVKQKVRFEATLQTACQPHADILELNCIRRILSILSSIWDDSIQDLLCSLKSPKSTFGFDSIDSFFSFLKDISFGSSKNTSPDDSTEVTTILAMNLDHFNQEHVQGTGSSADVGAISPVDILQTEKTKVIHASESPSDVEASGTVSNDSTMVDGLRVSSFVDMTSNDGSIDKDLSKECPKACQKDRMMEATIDSDRAPFLDTGVEDRLSTSGNFAGSIDQNFSEGYFSAYRDLSATFEAAWTGNGQIVEALGVNIATNGQEIPVYNAGTEILAASDGLVCGGKLSSSEGFDESPTDYHMPKISSRTSLSSGENGVTRADSQLASTLISPAKSGEPSDIEGWVGLPYLSLCGNGQSLLTGSSPKADAQILSSSPFVVMPHADGVMAQEGVRISLPVGINDTIVSVYDDEPTSIIAYAITSREHQARLSERSADKDKPKDKEKEHKEKVMLDHYMLEGVVTHPLQQIDGSSESGDSSLKDKSSNLEDSSIASSNHGSFDDPILFPKSLHIKISFNDDTPQGNIKYTVTCYNARQFDALRKKCCPTVIDLIRSLCRCKKWGAQGGKSNVFFAKTADDRFVVKQVTKTELESFLSFAPAYFKYISDALNSGSPTCLAKILGIYQIMVKHGKVGKEVRMDLMVMENLLYGRQVNRIYDLKGSVRSRYNADATGKNAVLLDQNLLESMQTNPIFIRNKAKRLLERAVWNDTAFLASVDVMDYSLLVGIDEERQDLVLGIIDFMRQYTWDKHLETWVKASGILGGPKNASPTVISPKQYKKRFRKAMSTYFLMVPDQWSPPAVVSGSPQVGAINESSLPSTKGGASDDLDTNV